MVSENNEPKQEAKADVLAGILALVSDSKAAKQNKSKKKELQKKAAVMRQTSEQDIEFRKSMRWKDLGIVLMIHRKTCSCGSVHESPNDCLFLLKSHATLGKNYVELTCEKPLELYHLLPQLVEYRDTQVAGCPDCFQMIRQVEDGVQLRLAL